MFANQLGLLVGALVFAPLATAQTYYSPQPLPRPCTGPSCVSDYPTDASSNQYQDTALIRHTDGTYYRFSKGNHTGLGLNVVTSPSLTGKWTYQGTILGGRLKSSCGSADGQASSWRWAPEIHLVDGTYYLYYTVEHPNGGNTCFDQCVATSKTLALDSWTDVGSMNIPPFTGQGHVPYVRLDGNLLSDSSNPSGVASPLYMVFGSYNYGLYGVPLANLTAAQPGATPQLIVSDQHQTPAASVQAKPGSDKSGNYSEGAYQLRHGKWIYLFYSRGSCCSPSSDSVASVYQTQVCRTAAANGPTGEYFDRAAQSCRTGGSKGQNRPGSVFLYSNAPNGADATVFAPGSVGVLDDPNEGLIMWYQYQNNKAIANVGFGWNHLAFDDEEWPILKA